MLSSIIRSLGLTASGARQAPRPFRYAVLEHTSGQRTFAKTYPAHTREEFQRGRIIADVGKLTGLFRAPEPLHMFEDRCVILWEYIEGLSEMRAYVLERTGHGPQGRKECRDFFLSSGRALAAIHDGLSPTSTHVEASPIPEVRSGSDILDRHAASELSKCPRRPLHWDYSCGNLFVGPQGSGTPGLVILDAMPNHYVLQKLGPNVVCPIYVDIAQMIFSVYCHPRFSRAIQSDRERYVSHFLSGYSAQSQVPLDYATAFACAAEISQMYEQFRRRRETGRFSVGAVLDRRFMVAAGRRLNDLAVKSLSGRSPVQTASRPEEMSR
jgi:hypothetical protein